MRVASLFALAVIAIAASMLALWRGSHEAPAVTALTLPSATTQRQSTAIEAAGSAIFNAETHQAGATKTGRTRETASNLASPLAPLSTPSGKPAELQLTGVLWDANRQQSIALLGIKGLAPEVVRTGDDFLAWHIVAIEQNEVQLQQNTQSIRIRLAAPENNSSRRRPMADSAETPRLSNFYAGPRVAGVPGLD